jgi:glycerate kinase
MKILIAADSFKDALPAPQVCTALERGIRYALPHATIECCPLADGGEGTLEVLATALQLQRVEMNASDPLHRPLVASYFLSTDGQTAFIEMAATAGLQLLRPEERNPLHTSTFGIGQQIAHALGKGVKKIVLAIGGSATNDAGTGMAMALGWQFLDKNGQPVMPVGANLLNIRQCLLPPETLPSVEVEVICDVNNPLFGQQGAAYVYAPQKGADEEAVERLDKGLRHFAAVVAQAPNCPSPNEPGTGAAGGMGFGARVFLGAQLRRGIEVVLSVIQFDQKLSAADCLVTGEGKLDAQTAQGKLIAGLCERAARHDVPVVAFCGQLEASEADLKRLGLHAAFCINDPANDVPLAGLLARTAENLETTARRVFSEISIPQKR